MRITRFEFNHLHDFRPNAQQFLIQEMVEEVQKEAIIVPEKPMFSEQQLEAAREAGRVAGYDEGVAAALAKINAESAEREQSALVALTQIEQQLLLAHTQFDEIIAAEARQTTQLAVAVAKKIAGEALSNMPEMLVQELLLQCMPVLMAKPKLTIELPSAIKQTVSERLESFWQKSGYDGEVIYKANDSMQPDEAAVEWSGGRAQRNTQELWQQIESMLGHLSHEDQPAV